MNQPEKINQWDSFLPTEELAYKTVFYFKRRLNKWEEKRHEMW